MIFNWDRNPGWTGLGFEWVFSATSEIPPPPSGSAEQDEIAVGIVAGLHVGSIRIGEY